MKLAWFGAVIAAAFLSSNLSHASYDFSTKQALFSDVRAEAQDTSYFTQIAEMFAQGTRPSAAKVLNTAWAGRCFTTEAPNKAIAAGYYLRRANSNDAGPIGNPQFEAASYWAKSQPANYYDYKPVNPYDGTHTFYHAELRGDAIVSYQDKTLSELRLSGRYLVEAITDITNGPISPSRPFGYCYYFIPGIQN